MFWICVLLFFQLGFQETKCSMSAVILHEVKKVILNKALSLNCTYNCSGFTRGFWRWEKTPACSHHACHWNQAHTKSGGLCSVSISTSNLSLEQTLYNYSCVSEKTDNPELPKNTELLVTLQWHNESEDGATPPKVLPGCSLRVKLLMDHEELEVPNSFYTIEVNAGTSLSLHCNTLGSTPCEVQWVRENSSLPLKEKNRKWSDIKAEDSGQYKCQVKGTCSDHSITVEVKVITRDGLIWVKIFASFALSAMVVLIAHLVYLCYRRFCERTDSVEQVHERISNSSVMLRRVAEDSQSDHDVPYADIVISVRGASNPDVSDTFSHSSKHLRTGWRDEARAGFLSASADTLHIHSKEVTRKLSTTSDYAVITYSCETLKY